MITEVPINKQKIEEKNIEILKEYKNILKRPNKIYLLFKRVVDIVISTIALVICAIPMLIVYICIKVEDGNPAIYKQIRTGKNGKNFYIYKFRTMKIREKDSGKRLSHEEMVTKVGKILRATSIDEIPQLINILKGEMTFIGPRPWMIEYYACFTEEQKRRTSVTPGITGLAQIKGRNGITIFEKIKYDLEYIDNMGIWMDTKIFLGSIISVIKKTNAEISEDGIREEIKELQRQDERILQNK